MDSKYLAAIFAMHLLYIARAIGDMNKISGAGLVCYSLWTSLLSEKWRRRGWLVLRPRYRLVRRRHTWSATLSPLRLASL